MASPRATSFKALRNLQKGACAVPAGSRALHITGVHGSPQRIDPSHKTTYISWGLSHLREECRKRTLGASGTKYELIDRLAAHDSLQSRAFSLAMRRIAKDNTGKPISGPAETMPQRSYHVSPANQTARDASTIDFAYLPKLFEGEFIPQPAAMRVPILGHIESDTAEANLEQHPHLDAAAGGYQDTDAGQVVMRPQVESVDPSIVTNFSILSDVHDGSPREISIEVLSKLGGGIVGQRAEQLASMIKDEDETVVRRVWNGFLDDLFGSNPDKAAKAEA